MRRHELSGAQWARSLPLLPSPARTGRPPTDLRRAVDAIYRILATGAPWRDLPERYDPWQTAYGRWERCEGVWQRALEALQREAGAGGGLDWALHFVDGSVVRAQRSAAGARKGAATRPSGARREAGEPRST